MRKCMHCNSPAFLLEKWRNKKTYKCTQCHQTFMMITEALEPDQEAPIPIGTAPGITVDDLATMVANEVIPLSNIDSACRSEVEQALVSRSGNR